MRGTNLSFIVCAAAMVMASAAHAADVTPVPPAPPPPAAIVPPPPPVDVITSGWYLRGDIGYRLNYIGHAALTATPDPNNSRVKDSISTSIGIGMKHGWLRADITLDYGFPEKYRGDTMGISGNERMSVENVTGLSNIYADLGTWWGVTPYIGAGAGASYMRALNFSTGTNPVPFSSPATGQFTFTWALMAGIAYDFGPVLLDIGYRRLQLGNVNSAADVTGNQLQLHNLSADEVRIGLRWML